jgi:hypothetical protein
VALDFVAGDNQPSLFGTLTIGGVVVDLTSATSVDFQMRLAMDRRFLVDAPADIITAAEGTVRYDWADGDLATPGDCVGRWQINWSDGSTQHSDPVNGITVSPA